MPLVAHEPTETGKSRVTPSHVPRALAPIFSLGYGTSILLHVALFLLLSIVILEHSKQSAVNAISSVLGQEGGASDSGSFENESGGGDFTTEPVLEQPANSASPPLPTDVSTLLEVPPQNGPLTIADLPSMAAGKAGTPGAAGEGGAGGSGREGEFVGGFAYAIPKTGRAVIQGNFAAWTVPEDPKPKQAYKIVIQIKLPDHVKNYALADLSGLVEGTDQYKQPIPATVRGFLPVIEHQSQLVIDVPGAEALVKDTIVIRSRVLSETQRLEIVF